jgi:transcription-repair coupling factor (superfamily II helicase)
VGSLKGGTNKEKKKLIEKIQEGEIDLVIGPMLLSKKILFSPDWVLQL